MLYLQQMEPHLTCTIEELEVVKAEILSLQQNRLKPLSGDELVTRAKRQIVAYSYHSLVEGQLVQRGLGLDLVSDDNDERLAVNSRIIASLAEKLEIITPSQN